MRQIQGFQNKVTVPSFSRDGAWHTVDLSGILDADAKFVEVEMVFGSLTVPPGLLAGLRPTGTNLGDDVWLGQFQFPAYTTLTMRVNALGEVDFNCNRLEGDVDFFVTGEWGGDAVVDFGVDYPQATGWTTGNSGTYREFDLTSLIPVEDQGNVEAVLFYARFVGTQANRHESADARANGSTLDYYSPDAYPRETRIAKVDDGNLIEVREDALYTKGVPGVQNSFVHFAGYVRRGNHDDGTGDVYVFDTIVDGVIDGVSNGVWTAYDVRPVTSSDVVAIYWSLKVLWDDFLHDYYCREIGSTDAAVQQGKIYQANKILGVDASFEVQHKLTAGPYQATRVYGWLDFIGALPGQATSPVPPHLSADRPLDQQLGWTAGAGATFYDVYFGTDSSPDAGEFQGNQPGTAFNPGPLEYGTTYYWRIDAKNALGTASGTVWSFTTLSNPCDWFDEPALDPDWQTSEAEQDWAGAAAPADWFDEPALDPDWLAIAAPAGWALSEAGQGWLTSEAGQGWLTSEAGQGWLTSEAGQAWLASEAGQAWAGAASGASWHTKKECN